MAVNLKSLQSLVAVEKAKRSQRTTTCSGKKLGFQANSIAGERIRKKIKVN